MKVWLIYIQRKTEVAFWREFHFNWVWSAHCDCWKKIQTNVDKSDSRNKFRLNMQAGGRYKKQALLTWSWFHKNQMHTVKNRQQNWQKQMGWGRTRNKKNKPGWRSVNTWTKAKGQKTRCAKAVTRWARQIDWQRLLEKDRLKCTYFKRTSETLMYAEEARERQRQEVERDNKAHEDEPYKIKHEITYWNAKPWHDCVSVLHDRRHISEGTHWPHVCQSFVSLNAWAYLYSKQYALDMTVDNGKNSFPPACN